MAVIPENKQWMQRNDGDSLGNIFASWNIDLNTNKGSLLVSNPLKTVYDSGDNGSFPLDLVGQFAEYGSKIFAISSYVYDVSTSSSTDITSTANWDREGTPGSPDPGATVTDAVVFDGLLLVQDSTTIRSYNGSTWVDWWRTTLGQSALTAGETFILKVLGNFVYITDGGNKVHSVDVDGNVAIAGTDSGTLDFSATPHIFKCATTTSTRIFYGTEDTAGENAYIVEWDGAENSLTANRIHNMGCKRVLNMVTWNDTPIAILSDGRIVYFNGSAFVDWPNAQLPISKNGYQDDIIHKNGSAIIDGLPHFLINPTVDIDDDTLAEDTSNNWYYPAGIYCLDPERGLYLRYALSNDASSHYTASRVGALFARNHKNTKLLAGYEVRTDNSTTLPMIACEDRTSSFATQAWLIPTPFESVQEVIKQVTVVHKKLGTGDEINFYYTRDNPESVRIEGTWLTSDTINTTDSIGDVDDTWIGFVKSGKNGYFLSKVDSVSSSDAINSIQFANAAGATLNDTSVIEFVNFKKMGSVQAGKEITDLNIPESKRSRQVWILIEMKQASGNNIQLDYLLTQ